MDLELLIYVTKIWFMKGISDIEKRKSKDGLGILQEIKSMVIQKYLYIQGCIFFIPLPRARGGGGQKCEVLVGWGKKKMIY